WCVCGIVCFFFFQAEDGIRDFHVTGVQTCALPICAARAKAPTGRKRLSGRIVRGSRQGTREEPRPAGPPEKDGAPVSWAGGQTRSEERRVGKEGGGRGWAQPQGREGRGRE